MHILVINAFSDMVVRPQRSTLLALPSLPFSSIQPFWSFHSHLVMPSTTEPSAIAPPSALALPPPPRSNMQGPANRPRGGCLQVSIQSPDEREKYERVRGNTLVS